MTVSNRAAASPSMLGDTPDLALRRFGFLFAGPDIERRYRQWSTDRKIPLIRVGMAASAAGYAVYLLTVGVLEPQSLEGILPAVIGFIGLLSAIFLASYFEISRSLLVPLTVTANCISGLLLFWQIHGLIESPDRFALAATATLIPVMFGFCVYQFGPLLAALATMPFIVLTLGFLYFDFHAGTLSTAMSGSLAAILIVACNTGVFASSVIEINNRRAFRKDQIIERQRLQLQESRDAICRYVPPSVADLIIKGQAHSVATPQRRQVTILFADIVSFTEVSDLIDPEDLTTLLVDYLSGMAAKIEEFGGTLNEFAGDGLMALFGAPDELEPEIQAQRAISAAREMQLLISRLNVRWAELGIERSLKMRIGINTGIVSVGSYGSQGRMTYTALGLQTNIASRIEQAADPGTILISNSTYQLACNAFDLEARGDVACKGLQYPVAVYALRETPPH
jgi:class 3 adenylate cyclase